MGVFPQRLAMVLVFFLAPLPAAAQTARPPVRLHSAFDELLGRYVSGTRVRYAAWARSAPDMIALSAYIDRLQAQKPSGWRRDDALAFWIDLYNATTLQLVLKHYPVNSIREIKGPLRSPWKQMLVRVEGRQLSLEDIEQDKILATFGDPRVHFALTRAALGGPALAPKAYTGPKLEAQLEAATREAVNDSSWVAITPGELRLSRIFDWYRGDFDHDSSTVESFLARYRPRDRRALLRGGLERMYVTYDWQLDEAR